MIGETRSISRLTGQSNLYERFKAKADFVSVAPISWTGNFSVFVEQKAITKYLSTDSTAVLLPLTQLMLD